MKLRTFLAHRQKQEAFRAPVHYFFGERYPALFSSLLIEKLKELYPSFKVIHPEKVDWQELQALLNTTFLGAIQTFWLGDLSILDARTKKKLLIYLETYQGPHTVLCYVSTKDAPSKSTIVINIAEALQKIDIEALFQFFWENSAERFLKMVQNDYKTLPLDSILLIGQYSILLGGKTQVFMRSWYEKIVLPESSLFVLSQSFFARKRDMFFRSWLSLKDDYNPVFWTVFWSEQLWRASHVVTLRKAQKFNDAKQMSYRLPFSFLQSGWQNVTSQELNNAHDFLYQVDCRVKSGGSELALEHFYNKFFSRQF